MAATISYGPSRVEAASGMGAKSIRSSRAREEGSRVDGGDLRRAGQPHGEHGRAAARATSKRHSLWDAARCDRRLHECYELAARVTINSSSWSRVSPIAPVLPMPASRASFEG